MNYKTLYKKIVDNAKIRNFLKGGNVVVESHHIIPKSCGGSNTKDNKVNLTLREHYVCHLLLAKIYKGTTHYSKMCRAVVAMSQRGAKNSRCYTAIREAHIQNLKKQVITDKQKKAISIANTGNKSRTGQKNSPEHIEALRQARIGSKHSQETKERWSKIRKGRDAHNKGITGVISFTQQTKTCPHCGKVGGASMMTRWHFDNCKFKEKSNVS